MKVLFTGADGSGAWTMRGEQMAATRQDWKAVPHATRHDAQGMDVVVIVKKISNECLAEMKAWGGLLVYDALDFWRQRRRFWETKPPLRDLDDARALVRPVFERIDPDLILCPTQTMVEDIEPLGWRTRLLYHHCDPRLEPIGPAPQGRKRIVYHGRPNQLGQWKTIAKVSCFLHGAEFLISNGAQPAPGEVLLGVRRADPWISRRWKSNVKAAIALKLGLPFVAWPEAGYRETHPSAFWFTNPFEMHRAIGKALTSERTRPDDRFSVEACAVQLEGTLGELISSRITATSTLSRSTNGRQIRVAS